MHINCLSPVCVTFPPIYLFLMRLSFKIHVYLHSVQAHVSETSCQQMELENIWFCNFTSELGCLFIYYLYL